MARFEDRIVPCAGLHDVVLPERLMVVLEDLIGFEKARNTLSRAWGFSDELERGMGTTALFHGVPGTGNRPGRWLAGCPGSRPRRLRLHAKTS